MLRDPALTELRSCVQISQNPKLTNLNLPFLEAIGGPLIIQNNSALASLESLEHLASVNATGKIPSITIPGLQVCGLHPRSEMNLYWRFIFGHSAQIFVLGR